MEDDQRSVYLEYAKAKSHEMQVWERDYRTRILRILSDKNINPSLETIPEIIEATSFRVLSSDPEYKTHCSLFRCTPPKQCHSEIGDLNCFLCSCPNYDSGFIEITENAHERILVGKCKTNSKKAGYHFPIQSPGIGFWDCSDCTAYHYPQAIEKYLREHMEELQEQARYLKFNSFSETQ